MTHPRLAKKQAMNRTLKALLADPLCMEILDASVRTNEP
jgi:hypothetical protein